MQYTTYICNFFSEKESSFLMKLVSVILSILGLYPQFRALKTVLIAYGYVQGDWVKHRDESKILALIEPVTEGIMQLFCQLAIIYIVHGPGVIALKIE